jgi:hypothetical protein
MREHLEALNHIEAIALSIWLTSLLNEELISIHSLILRGMLPKEAGQYHSLFCFKRNSFLLQTLKELKKRNRSAFNWYKNEQRAAYIIILTSRIKTC